MHNGNIAFFTTTNGTPVDIDAKELADNNKLPTITDAILGRVKITKMHEIVIPKEIERIGIIYESHSTPLGGHKGVSKTFLRIRQVLLAEPETRHTKFYTTMSTIDHKIREKLYSNNSRLLTKYSMAIPLRQASSEEIADTFIKNVICRFGSPKDILSDQGSNFNQTSAYHPQSNGSIKRSHLVLIEFLKHFITDNSEWDEWIEIAMFSYNTSVHEGTLYTSHELVLDQLARTPNESIYNDLQNETYAHYLGTLNEQINKSQEAAKQNFINAKNRSKKYYDKKQRVVDFKVGNKVHFQKGSQKDKFDDKYIGSFKIVEILSKHNINIRTDIGDRVVHANRLKVDKSK
ncbi:uncharacterized protein LOC118450499 [Vespa mandarinia]|uniref:uncharacterized protein LOC118450499 n=1 Tax=Vespa mandarinia TaxID=7446 RepID=UPI00160B04B0|nr:uncharacterized protein LOC118450499 [Vespa mandarinia]